MGIELNLRWPRLQRSRRAGARRVNTSALELETAKEILAEVFHAQPGDVEEMIERRLLERSWMAKKEIRPQDGQEGTWPVAFQI